MLSEITFSPGFRTDDTPLLSKPQWVDGDRVRFEGDQPQPIGGWQQAAPETMRGVARGIFSWTAPDGRTFTAIGTDSALYALIGGGLWDITPIRAEAVVTWVRSSAGRTWMTVRVPVHRAKPGDIVLIRSGETIGGITLGHPNRTIKVTVEAEGLFARVDARNHSFSTGDMIEVSGSKALGGVNLSGRYCVRVINDDVFTIDLGQRSGVRATVSLVVRGWRAYEVVSAATDTFRIDLGESAVVTATSTAPVAVAFLLGVGNRSGRWTSGFGAEGFGESWFGVADSASFESPRTWTMGTIMGQLVACPADPGGGAIYRWALSGSRRAVLIEEAPRRCAGIMVTAENILLAWGATHSQRDPLAICWSDRPDVETAGITTWEPDTTNLAGFNTLGHGTRVVRVIQVGPAMVAFTDTAAYSITFTGDSLSIYAFNIIATEAGLIGPNAVTVMNNMVIWATPHRQFMAWSGGVPTTIPCPVSNRFWDVLPVGQHDKVWFGTNTHFGEVVILYPGASEECDRYLLFAPNAGWWAFGTLERTCWVDADTFEAPLAAAADGVLHRHEVGTSAQGLPLGAWLLSSPFEVGEKEFDINGLVVDVHDFAVGMTVTLETREYPRGSVEVDGPHMVTPDMDYVDLRASGGQAQLRFSSVEDGGVFWRLGAIKLDISAGGNRR